MAKILIADDNSNIQKMVVLALKDQGIEVVAVGNGEAAVRKANDIKPDLILADVFMPVRNGYEVCKYVKDSPALAHIPVILLVGAFDPLDEQEAQRVGADGVLKKPFVPPDPLISMVKAALARAGVPLEKSAAPPPAPVAVKSEPPPPPKIAPPPAPVFAAVPEEEFAISNTVASRPSPFSIDKGAQPLAFGSLLDSPAIDEDSVFAVSPTTHAAPDRDWGGTAEAEEEEEQESKGSSWRSTALPEEAEETPAGQKDWREAAFSGVGSEQSHGSGWAPSIEKSSLAITEEEAAAISSNVRQDWAKEIAAVLPATAAPVLPVAEASRPELSTPPPPPPVPIFNEPSPVAETEQSTEQAATATVNAWMAGATNPWEAELNPAGQLASTWETAKLSPAMAVEDTSATEAFLDSGLLSSGSAEGSPVPAEISAEPPIGVSSELSSELPAESVAKIESLLSPVTQEVLQEEVAHAAADVQPSVAEETILSEPPPSATAASAPDLDDLVAKVLAKMNPEVLQAVTREILKPLVEAMVKDELNKK